MRVTLTKRDRERSAADNIEVRDRSGREPKLGFTNGTAENRLIRRLFGVLKEEVERLLRLDVIRDPA